MLNPLSRALKVIVARAKPNKVILFGSRVSGNSRKDSDYDLLVLKKGTKKNRAVTQDIYRHLRNIGAPVDIIVADLTKYERLKSDPYLIYIQAAKYGKVVYEKSR